MGGCSYSHFGIFGFALPVAKMRNNFPFNRMQALRLARYERIIKFHFALMIVLCAGIVFFPVKPAWAADDILSENNTLTGTVSGMAQCGGGFSSYPIGTNLDGTVEEILVSLKRVGTSSKTVFVGLQGFTSTGVLAFTYNTISGGLPTDPACGTVNAGGNGSPFSLKSCVPTTPFALNPDLFYYIRVCGNGFSGTTTSIETGSGTLQGISAPNIAVHRLEGTAYVPPSGLTLTYSTGATVTTKTDHPFTVEWFGQAFAVYNIFFYEDVEDTAPVKKLNNFPIEGGQVSPYSYNFTHRFGFTGTYHPDIGIGNSLCTTATASGCTIVRLSSLSDGLTISSGVPDFNVLFPSEFSVNRTQIAAGESVDFTWNVNHSVCAPSTVSGKRLFKGYPGNLQYRDSGAILPVGSTGALTVTYDEAIGVIYYPHILTYCSNGTSFKLYLGDTWKAGQAQWISVLSPDDQVFWMPESWDNGGFSPDFGAGSGQSFFSDKTNYDRYEPVKLRWTFNVPFTVGSVVLYKDPAKLNEFFTFDEASDLIENTKHYGEVIYVTGGDYQPMVQVRSTAYDAMDPATYQNIYLGGGSSQNAAYEINVSLQLYSAGGGSGTGTFLGMDKELFKIQIGDDAPLYLRALTGLANTTIGGLLYLGEWGYGLVEQAPLFSWVVDMIHPQAGVEKILPSALFNIEMPDELLADRTYTIAYGTNDFALRSLGIAQMLIAAGVIFWLVRKFF